MDADWMNDSHNEAWSSSLFTLRVHTHRGLGTTKIDSSWQYYIHSMYIENTFYYLEVDIIRCLHQSWGIWKLERRRQRRQKRHRLLSFYSIFSHIESLVRWCACVCVFVYFDNPHQGIFDFLLPIRPKQRQQTKEWDARETILEVNKKRDQEIVSPFIHYVSIFYVLCVLCPTILSCYFFLLLFSVKLTNELSTVLQEHVLYLRFRDTRFSIHCQQPLFSFSSLDRSFVRSLCWNMEKAHCFALLYYHLFYTHFFVCTPRRDTLLCNAI